MLTTTSRSPRRALPFALLALALSLPVPALAQGDEPYPTRSYQTAHTGGEAPRIDGRLDDPAWQRVEWGSDFLQHQPDPGAPPSVETRFKILYDDDALYLAVHALDDPDQVARLLSRRDGFPGDWVEFNIDSYHDHRTAYSFTCSASGVRGDEFISNDGNHWDGSWDPVWQLETATVEDGWVAEVRIPLSQLRFSREDEQVWGLQVQRRMYREQERSLWQPRRKDETGWVSRFGEIHGIQGLTPGRRVELMPYGLSRGELDKEEPGNPFRDGQDGSLAIGLDGKVGLGSNFTLDLTVNPDFGQVEADPSQVNLSAFETFFSERRPFFIEGRNILDFELSPAQAGGPFTRDNLFYSRRIGRRPSVGVDLDSGEYADMPENSSILGAAKLSGKTASGWSVGLLESVTGREQARIQGPGGERHQVVEPLTNYTVGRVQKDFDRGNTRFGAMFTSVNRDLEDPRLRTLHRNAFSGAVDGYHRWGDQRWSLAGNLAFSEVQGEPEALLATQTSSARYFQRPDNGAAELDSSRTSLFGTGGSGRVQYIGANRWRFETGMGWRSPGFEINDIGFLRQADQLNHFAWYGYHINEPVGPFRAIRFNGNHWVDWDFDGVNLERRGNLNFNAESKNQWRFGGGVDRWLESTSNTALRGGPRSKWPGGSSGWLWFNSPQRVRYSYGFGGSFQRGDENSQATQELWADLTLRPTNALRFSLSSFLWGGDKSRQWVGSSEFGGDDRFLFGEIDQRVLGITMRMDYIVTPDLSVQFYGSPFVATGRYSGFRRVTDPRADDFADRFAGYDAGDVVREDGDLRFDEDGDGTTDYTVGDPDFNVREFNSNLVVRWEFSPGSQLFVVWSQSRGDFSPDGRFRPGRDIDQLFEAHPRDVFLVKVAKWFSL